MAGGDAEQGAECGVPGAAAVEAEDELVEIGLQVPAAQAVVDAQGPHLEVGEDPVHPGQDNVGGHLADDTGIVFDAGSAGVGGPSVGFGGGAWGEVIGDEGVQTGGRVVGHFGETDAAGSGAAALELDGADDEHLALMAAATATGQRIVFAAARDFGFVDLDQAVEGDPAGCDHAAAQLAAQEPGTAVRSQAELALQLQSRDPVGMGGHQIGRPEPGGQRQLGMVHDGPGGHRGLFAAASALPEPAPAKAGVHGLVCSSHALVMPQLGQTNPSGQRAAKRYLTQAASSAKQC